ncbi:MAG: hypothetical protein ACXVS6_22680 [Solirubrobacteraceae bacterium]
MDDHDQHPEHDPVDEDDDLYSALAAHEGPWVIGDPDDGEMLPISREQIAQALAWRRRLANGD